MKKEKTLRVCENGHNYYKSSDCPVCPICENTRDSAGSFLSAISATARRALENNAIDTLKKLAKKSEKEILELHGIGPSSIPKLREALQSQGLFFKK